MRRALAVVSLCFAFTFVGCGGSDTSNPMAACDSFARAVCNRTSSCNLLGTTSVSQCVTALEAAASCSTASCSTGTTFSSTLASQCISDVNAESCQNIMNAVVPTSCLSRGCL